MICLTCDTYPCVCYWVPPRKSDTVMSEARALVGVVLLMVTLVWAFWYASQRREAANCRGFESSQGCVLPPAQHITTHETTTESGR